jgi:hypothetical protein
MTETATEAERMQAMGHADPNIYRRHYLNQIVSTDTLACLLSSPSGEGIMRLAGHMSLTRDANAPTALSPSQRDELREHPQLRAAIEARDEERKSLIAKHQKIKLAKIEDPRAYARYCQYQRSAKAIDVRLKADKLKAIREEYFATVGARHIERQHREQSLSCAGETESPSDKTMKPTDYLKFELEERNLLPALLFGTLDPDVPKDDGGNLAQIIRVFRSLCRRCARPTHANDVHFKSLALEEIEHDEQVPDTYPIIVPGTVSILPR